MNTEATPPLTAADLAAVSAFAAQSGLDTSTLIRLSVQAMAAHIRQHGTLTLPVQIGVSSPFCVFCPHSRAQKPMASTGTNNIVPGPWPS